MDMKQKAIDVRPVQTACRRVPGCGLAANIADRRDTDWFHGHTLPQNNRTTAVS